MSSDNDVLSVKYSGTNAGSVKPMNIKVDQMAAGQLNEGARMNANTAYGASGTSKFSISINNKTTELSVNVASGDSNKTVQQKMADAINAAGIGVKASVETDAKNNASMLKLESTMTGADEKSKFTVSDVSGNLVARTGANDISKDAQNAVYSVNGGAAQTSKTNTIDFGGGLSVTFNKASDKAVEIKPGKDTDYAKKAVENMVNSYNDLYSAAAVNVNDPKAQNLASKMVSISKTYSGSLANIGIGFNKDGQMTVDAKKLDAAAKDGRLDTFFTEDRSRNYGFSNQISKLASNVTNNTASYVSRNEFRNPLIEDFPYSSYGEILRNNYGNAGWFLDMMY